MSHLRKIAFQTWFCQQLGMSLLCSEWSGKRTGMKSLAKFAIVLYVFSGKRILSGDLKVSLDCGFTSRRGPEIKMLMERGREELVKSQTSVRLYLLVIGLYQPVCLLGWHSQFSCLLGLGGRWYLSIYSSGGSDGHGCPSMHRCIVSLTPLLEMEVYIKGNSYWLV